MTSFKDASLHILVTTCAFLFSFFVRDIINSIIKYKTRLYCTNDDVDKSVCFRQNMKYKSIVLGIAFVIIVVLATIFSVTH